MTDTAARAVTVLRPEPGNATTCAAVAAAGLTAIPLPLFVVVPLPWTVPEVRDHDALLLTSANAVRQAGAQLAALVGLPVLAVGAATAHAARASGFRVTSTGTSDATAVLARRHGFTRILHIGGRERSIGIGGGVTAAVTVYASEPCDIADDAVRGLAETVALLHSARAARRLRSLLDVAGIDPGCVRIAALSLAVATAAGPGWQDSAVAAVPTDATLVATARRLASDRHDD